MSSHSSIYDAPQPNSASIEDLDAGTLTNNQAPAWKVISWGLWDWGTQPFATVITTFVFAVYLTSKSFGPENHTNLMLAWSTGIAGFFIALLAPLLGQGSDRSGRRMFNLKWQTWALAAISAALWFVKPEPSYLILGLVLLGVGNVIQEIGNVNYYAAIDQVSTPKTVGRISGLGWGMGYLGGISILVLIVALFSKDGFSSDEIRFSMLLCGVWTLIFTLPIFVALKDRKPTGPLPQRSILQSYRDLFSSLKRVYRNSPNTIYFLLASALFRDGLAGVFAFGAVLAAGTFGFQFSEIIIFGIAANLLAGLATIGFGFLDDQIGPKKVIMISLIALVGLGITVFFLHNGGKEVFWVCGLLMTLFVGPAQSASRSFLARAIPAGKSGEIFGLYTTTGRVVSFFSPLAFGGAILLGQAITGTDQTQYFGILGVTLVIAAGLLVMIPVKEGGHSFSH